MVYIGFWMENILKWSQLDPFVGEIKIIRFNSCCIIFGHIIYIWINYYFRHIFIE